MISIPELSDTDVELSLKGFKSSWDLSSKTQAICKLQLP